jgi:hypothetical protein
VSEDQTVIDHLKAVWTERLKNVRAYGTRDVFSVSEKRQWHNVTRDAGTVSGVRVRFDPETKDYRVTVIIALDNGGFSYEPVGELMRISEEQ